MKWARLRAELENEEEEEWRGYFAVSGGVVHISSRSARGVYRVFEGLPRVGNNKEEMSKKEE